MAQETIAPAPASLALVQTDGSSDLVRALARIKAKLAICDKYSKYYRGQHNLNYATDKFRNAFGLLFLAFADNVCQVVCDAIADRLTITGFNTADPNGDPEIRNEVWTIWQDNRLDEQSGQAHLEAVRQGDAFVIVWPDDQGNPIIYPNESAMCSVIYDEEIPGLVDMGIRLWQRADGAIRMNLYYSDRIEKYATPGRQNAAYSMPDDAGTFMRYVPRANDGSAMEPWPLPNPWGVVPMFHFRNNAGVGKPGISELANVIPLQDALNKSVADMMVAMEFAAFPQRWATGLELEEDESTGRPKEPFKPGVERIWSVADNLARFGQFPAADLNGFLAVANAFRYEICRVSGIPLTYVMLMDTPPSGEALKTLEARFTKKLADRQISYGNTWSDVMSLAVRMRNNLLDPADSPRIKAMWSDAAPTTHAEQIATQKDKQAIGVSQQQSLQEIGYTQSQIEKMFEDRLKEAAIANVQAQKPGDPGSAAPPQFRAGGMRGAPSAQVMNPQIAQQRDPGSVPTGA